MMPEFSTEEPTRGPTPHRVLVLLLVTFLAAAAPAAAFAQPAGDEPPPDESGDQPDEGGEVDDEEPADRQPGEESGDEEPQRPQQGLVPPELSVYVEAYPDSALEEGLETTVVATLYINAEGEVVKAELLQPSEYEGYGFEDLALEAMQQFEFLPALKDGKAIPAKIQFTYEFAPPAPEVVEPEDGAEGDTETAGDGSGEEGDEETGGGGDVIPAVPDEKPALRMTGVVRERGTRQRLPGVLISLERGEELIEVYTDANGEFEVRGLAAGEWNVIIEEKDYGTYETSEEIRDNEVLEVEYYIERQYYDEYGTQGAYVYETRETRLRKEVNRRTLDVAEIQKIPGNNGDALKVVQNLPGVARSTFNSGQIIVRGSAPEDTQVLLDGAQIPLLYHFGGLSAVVNSDILSSIDFYPGNFSARYGRAMGGVLDVKTRPPRRDRISGYLDVDVIDTTAFLEGPILDNLSFQVGVRRSYFDALIPLILPDDIGLDLTTAPRYWDFQTRINWLISPEHEVEAFVYGSDDVLEFIFDEPNPTNPFVRGNVEAGTNFNRGQVTYKYRGDRFNNLFVYNVGNTTLNFGLGDQVRFSLQTITHTFREEASFDVNEMVKLITGFDIEVGTFSIDARIPDIPDEGEFAGGFETREFIEVERDGVFYQPAYFLETELQLTDALLLIVGGRLDYDKLSDELAADIRSTLRFAVNKWVTLKGGVGTFSQPPQPQETTKEFGNPDIGFERAVHYAVGVEWRLPFYEPLFFDVTGFYKSLNNLVAEADGTVERNGMAVNENFNNDGFGDVVGMEVLARHELANNLFGWVAYTFSRATRQDGYGEPRYPFEFDQTHILTMLASYKLPNQWQIGLRWRYVTGTPFTPRNGSVYDADADNYRPVESQKTNSERIEDFHQLDFRVDKSFVFDNWILSLYLDVQNVYFRSNAEAVQYNYDSTEFGFIRGLPILPSFGIKGEF